MGVATELGSFAFFVALWVSMMAAMMLPGAVPAVLRRAHASGRVRDPLPRRYTILSYSRRAALEQVHDERPQLLSSVPTDALRVA